MKPEIECSISVGIKGQVKGFKYKGEELAKAAARCVLEAEQQGNSGRARIHLEIKEESVPEVGQSRLAATFSAAIVAGIYEDGDGLRVINPAWVNDIANIIDQGLAEIRDAFIDLQPCPIVTHHPEGPCAFCAGFALRDVLMLKETL